jgi:transcriptional regulator with XRE-family HTH domain
MAKRGNAGHLEFAARFRALRKSLGLSQTALAELLGKPQSYISKVETCERRVDVIEALEICRALRVSLRILLPRDLVPFISVKAKKATKGKPLGHKGQDA